MPLIGVHMCSVQILINYAYACTYYSGIMLVAEKRLLFQKLCQHIRHQATEISGPPYNNVTHQEIIIAYYNNTC